MGVAAFRKLRVAADSCNIWNLCVLFQAGCLWRTSEQENVDMEDGEGCATAGLYHLFIEFTQAVEALLLRQHQESLSSVNNFLRYVFANEDYRNRSVVTSQDGQESARRQ